LSTDPLRLNDEHAGVLTEAENREKQQLFPFLENAEA